MITKLNKVASTLAVASVLLVGATYLVSSYGSEAAGVEPPLYEQSLSLAYGPQNFDEALKAADRDLRLAEHRVHGAPDEWLNQSSLAMGHLIRSQLTGSFDDLLAANMAIGKSAELAPEGTGPVVAASTINLSLHRYPAAQGFIDQYDGFAVKLDEAEKAEMLGQKGDVAFYSGDYATARAHYETALAQSETPNNIFRLANWEKYCGDFDKAIALYTKGAKAARFATPQMLSAYHIQIGALELQRGNWDVATTYFKMADAIFPGHWLARAHVAQMLAVQGKYGEAEAIYSEIVEQSPNPDVMMALADLKEFQGQDDHAMAIRDRASAIFAARLQELPEAYYDHGLDLALSVGDQKRALILATANFQARQFGDAKMALARSLAANGQAERAIELLLEVRASGWKSVELNLDLAQAYRLKGDEDAAQMYEEIALSANPMALDERSELLAFGSH